jgi:hypothetical protein
MKWKTLALLTLVALAGCGGGDDDDSADDAAGGGDGAADTSAAQAPAPEPIKGKITDAKLIKAAGLQKKGDHYVWSDGCEVDAVASSKAGFKKLQKEAANKSLVIPNKSQTAAIQISKQTYQCAVHASLFLRGVP